MLLPDQAANGHAPCVCAACRFRCREKQVPYDESHMEILELAHQDHIHSARWAA